VVAVGGGGPPDDPPPVRFDLLATDALGNPMLWRLLAAHNGIDDPTAIAPGTVLAVPPGVGGAPADRPASSTTGGRIAEPGGGAPVDLGVAPVVGGP
jgi:hypothetical protein